MSAAFLEAASARLPARVDVAGSAAQARQLAARHAHALWLVDANLPDGDGIDLLRALRGKHPSTPALAHTADDSACIREKLLAAGFGQVLVKPIAGSALLAALRAALGWTGPDTEPLRVAETAPANLWDDALALSALGGNAEHVRGLRSLFLQELAQQHDAVLEADHEGRAALLHRLLSSCGFVGAARLRDMALALQAAPEDALALQRFSQAAQATLASGREAGWDQLP